jgi:hypothetical protein
MLELIGIPFFIFGGFLALLGLALTLYVFYDIFVNQQRMQGLEKLIWIIVVISFNIVGVIAYLLIVKSGQTYLLDSISTLSEKRRLDDLERLRELREQGTLTEEEFKEEKKRILGKE